MVADIIKYGGERAAAALAMEDGLDWGSLSDAEKEFYYSKAYGKKQDKATTTPVNKPDKDKEKDK